MGFNSGLKGLKYTPPLPAIPRPLLLAEDAVSGGIIVTCRLQVDG
jgi:hypothetical protein